MSAKSIVTGGMKLKKEDGSRKTGDEMKAEVASAIFNIFKDTDFKNITDDITDAISMIVTYKRMDGNGIGKQSSNVKIINKKKLTNKKELQKKADTLSSKQSKTKQSIKKITKDKTVKKETTEKETIKKSKKQQKADIYKTAKKIVANVNNDVSARARQDLHWEIIKQKKINELIESNLPNKDKLKNDKKNK